MKHTDFSNIRRTESSILRNLQIHLSDLIGSSFKISLDSQTSESLFEHLPFNGVSLYRELSQLRSQRAKKLSSVKRDFLYNWKKGQRIPIDCLDFLCHLSHISLRDIEHGVTALSMGSSKNVWSVHFPIVLDKHFFLVSEAIRTEGCIVKGKEAGKAQGIAISNKDVSLLKLVEIMLHSLKVDSGFSRILNVIIYLDISSVTQVVNKRTNNYIHFHFHKGRLFFLEQVPSYVIDREYLVYIGNTCEPLRVTVSEDNLLIVNTRLKATSYLTLQNYHSTFAHFLSQFAIIPFGIGTKKSYTIAFPWQLDELSDEEIKTILNIVISCEGHVLLRARRSRAVRVKLASKEYLLQLQCMLLRFQIESSIIQSTSDNLWVLAIRGQSNLKRLKAITPLYVKYKQATLERIWKSYLCSRMPHYEADHFYLCALQKIEPATLKTVSRIMGRKYNTIISAFTRLHHKGLVEKYGKTFTGKGTTANFYKLSGEGYVFVKDGCTKTST